MLAVTAQTRTYNSLTGNVGVLYRLTQPVSLVLNVGRGFRAPSSFDLFANGVHEGTVAFEHGNPSLTTEKSINTDLAVRVQSATLALEVGGFVNLIQDYIYTFPTGATDSASGFPIYDATQGDARLTGAEASVQYHPTRWLHLQGRDYVLGQNTSTGRPLTSRPRATPRMKGPAICFSPTSRWHQSTRRKQADPAERQFYDDAFGGAVTGRRRPS